MTTENLSEMWADAGKPRGRSPANYKATATVKLHLNLYPSDWATTGRGVATVTKASPELADGYVLYLKTEIGSARKASSKPQDGSRVYTEAEVNAAAFKAYQQGMRDGYEQGKRHAGTRAVDSPVVEDIKARCQNAKWKFAREYHPDMGGDTRTMATINMVFDVVEDILNGKAA